ncbi:37S ribosomal protein S9, mitochondrial [Vermiconidia calcicola]|uniref:37S ribosomal protein S9, mitochondrial n=1 Tax=Vermiconidia calcicola TaxID=1690605 RepID=A0ACC3MF22_9PEZI|nr:37S ribosomal protein S9, mitochondrial [Vermiconidia calcicola]
MECSSLRVGFRRAIASSHNPAKRRVLFHQPRRLYASHTEPDGPIRAAPPINFTSDPDQFNQPHAELIPQRRNSRSNDRDQDDYDHLLRRIRIVPASPSYFTATPRYTDDLLHLSSLYRKHQVLPKVSGAQAPRVAWKTLQQYKTEIGEPVRQKGYGMLLGLLKRLNYIHPSLLPVEVQRALERYKRSVQPHLNQPKPIEIDNLGRARAVGRRKSSHAAVFVVEGEGECLINGRTLTDYFGRLHDRESAVWALKATQRLDKYNVWAIVRGGGTTGQAEALTLGVAKALLAHEPDLKPALRRAGCITRDPRRVERKKPGKLKARKMPAWVKR